MVVERLCESTNSIELIVEMVLSSVLSTFPTAVRYAEVGHNSSDPLQRVQPGSGDLFCWIVQLSLDGP